MSCDEWGYGAWGDGAWGDFCFTPAPLGAITGKFDYVLPLSADITVSSVLGATFEATSPMTGEYDT